jgi:hypothetical protein
VGELDTDDTTAEHQHVHIIVLNALVRRIGVMAQSGADPGNSVGGHRRANPAPAEQDAALGPVLAQSSAHGPRIVGIVHGICAVGAQIEDLAMLRGQEGFHRLLKCKSGMIRTYRDAHCSPRFYDLQLRRCDDVLEGEAALLLQFLPRCASIEGWTRRRPSFQLIPVSASWAIYLASAAIHDRQNPTTFGSTSNVGALPFSGRTGGYVHRQALIGMRGQRRRAGLLRRAWHDP